MGETRNSRVNSATRPVPGLGRPSANPFRTCWGRADGHLLQHRECWVSDRDGKSSAPYIDVEMATNAVREHSVWKAVHEPNGIMGLGPLPVNHLRRCGCERLITLHWEGEVICFPAQRDVHTGFLHQTPKPCALAPYDSLHACGRPHAFKAVFTVSLHGEKLRTDLRVINTGDAAFEFTAALHSYFEVLDIAKAKVSGLAGLTYLDKVRRFQTGVIWGFGFRV